MTQDKPIVETISNAGNQVTNALGQFWQLLTSNQSKRADLLYYLAQQIHPVVSRLVEPIEETDAVRIAESLVLDSSNYKKAAAAQAVVSESEDCLRSAAKLRVFCIDRVGR
ncbi:hypothetical protein GCK72_011854 [Caenorhabditis remanei]|uniref:DNA-directed DNA polymerase n=1 Tax=Caenorhabditis remanei TaxID=31234 RepID=A0A6A5H8P2_CAERE|nr:hypothetical protein GCK72_011854 [Caenorhabditis remanei]KAF1763587.1 hypothetical protein GCK72_011854 [Caenorhabditis remanei]